MHCVTLAREQDRTGPKGFTSGFASTDTVSCSLALRCAHSNTGLDTPTAETSRKQ